ncbi:MAG TPA: DUF2785 domain-containing protein, partial [Candidatus Polarisedimenticolia bacterium]|nr:DUF2785 domain-containing protein [Candidatus Polarisedimenticolia bacterium]
TPGALLLELCDLLGSPDPELRDGLAYEIAAAWIYQKKSVSDEDLRPTIALLEKNLTIGLGETGTDSVLRRSFSALILSLVAARDNAAPFLKPDEFDTLLSATLDYLAREKDTRGFVPGPGWHHSVAHTADVLKFLARSPKLQPADQKRILAGIALKASGSTAFWEYGEDDRLAAAVMSILKRDDLDAAAFETWAGGFVPTWRSVMEGPGGFDAGRYIPAKNGRDLLACLLVRLDASAPFANAERARAAVLGALKRM